MIRGLLPPIPTPFVDDQFSAPHYAENISRWNDTPLDGYVVLGSNGEAPLLDEAERALVIRTARQSIAAGRQLVAGAGRQSTRATIRSVREAFDLGADAVLVGVPDYFRPSMTDTILRDHYLRVADASAGPVLLYSVPFFTGLPIGPMLFSSLLGHDRIAGIKDSSGDLVALQGMLDASRDSGREVAVLIGNASVLAAGLEIGAAGAVLAVGTIAPRQCAVVAQLVEQGDALAARAANQKLLPLTQAVTRKHGIGGLKAALDLIGLYGGDPRLPLQPAGGSARAEIAAMLKDLSPLP